MCDKEVVTKANSIKTEGSPVSAALPPQRILPPLSSSTDPWRKAYESRGANLTKVESGPRPTLTPVRLNDAQVKAVQNLQLVGAPWQRGQPTDCRPQGVRLESVRLEDVFKARAVPKEDTQQNGPVGQGLSSSQLKKLQEKELKANKVEKLIKKVTVDRDKQPDHWTNEYEARKAAALSKIESGTAETNVGSLSAFHKGLYGQEETSDLTKSPPVVRGTLTERHHPPLTTVPAAAARTPLSHSPSSSTAEQPRPQKMDLQASASGTDQNLDGVNAIDETNRYKVPALASARKPPPSPADLLKMEITNPQVFNQREIEAKLEAQKQEELGIGTQEQDGQSQIASSAAPPGEMGSSHVDPRKMSIQQLFRHVKSDSKRSSQDWQEEYNARKQQRIEKESESKKNQILTGEVIDRIGKTSKLPPPPTRPTTGPMSASPTGESSSRASGPGLPPSTGWIRPQGGSSFRGGSPEFRGSFSNAPRAGAMGRGAGPTGLQGPWIGHQPRGGPPPRFPKPSSSFKSNLRGHFSGSNQHNNPPFNAGANPGRRGFGSSSYDPGYGSSSRGLPPNNGRGSGIGGPNRGFRQNNSSLGGGYSHTNSSRGFHQAGRGGFVGFHQQRGGSNNFGRGFGSGGPGQRGFENPSFRGRGGFGRGARGGQRGGPRGGYGYGPRDEKSELDGYNDLYQVDCTSCASPAARSGSHQSLFSALDEIEEDE